VVIKSVPNFGRSFQMSME